MRWLYPGLKVKRWILLFFLSLFLVVFSVVQFFRDTYLILQVFDVILFGIALIGIVTGANYLLRSFFEVIYPGKSKELIDIIYEKRFLSKGPKIVAIGGGTGLSSILEGLKEYTSNITAIVTVADEGGSSGRIREEFDILPPGDIRNCLVSLAEAPQLMRDLFQYRFKVGEGIKGHSFGNLFITAMTKITGSFKDAVKESSIVLAIRGKVVPSSLDKIRLQAQYSDGTAKVGEDKIPEEEKSIKKINLIPHDAKSNPEAIEAIREAEIIIFGPGSLFTSVIPNLLIDKISDEIAKRNIMKLYICNVMTQHGETDSFTAYDHLGMIVSHTKRDTVNCCLVNSGRLKHALLVKYAQEKSFPVIFDREKFKEIGMDVFEADVVSKVNYLRHDSYKTAKAVIYIYNRNKNKWQG